jgi:HK97 family phage portal protein
MWRWIQLKAVSVIARSLGLTDPRLYHWFAGGPTSSGENISIDSSLQIDTVFSCVRLIAQTIATLPLEVRHTSPNGLSELANDHKLFPVLRDQPNADMTAVVFWTAMIACLLLWGNAYAAIDRRGDKSVISLTPLLPSRLRVTRESDGSLTYHYSWMNVRQDYTEDQIFHIRGFTLDGIVGMSPVAQAREQLGMAWAAEKSAASFFKNGMRPSVVLTAPTYLSEVQRNRYGDSFIEKFSGSINAGKVPLIEGGWKIDTIGMNPEDAQLLSTRAFSVETICRWFGVNPVMIGHMEKTTAWGTGLEQMNLWFLTYTLRPLLTAIEQEGKRSLLTPLDKMLYHLEFDVSALLRTDSEKRAATWKALVDAGIAVPDEARADYNMKPMPGGDQLTMSAGRMPLKGLGQPPQPALPTPPADPGRQPAQPPPARQGA